MGLPETRCRVTNARPGLTTPTTRAFAAVELILCARLMHQEVFVP
jgi:hypothetical protein